MIDIEDLKNEKAKLEEQLENFKAQAIQQIAALGGAISLIDILIEKYSDHVEKKEEEI